MILMNWETNNIHIIRELFVYFLIVATIILGLVIFFTIFYGWKYRRRPNAETPTQDHGSKRFEVLMIGIAFAITSVFFVLTVNGMNQIQNIPDNPIPDIIITGHMWWWEAEYRTDSIITANEIHIPASKKVLVQFNSDDVIHSWWIPKLGRKMDLVPGYDNYMWLTAEQGEYWGTCSEFCGAQHALMRIHVIADNEDDFKIWKSSQLKPPPVTENPLFETGKRLFQEKTCISCHSVNIHDKEPAIGPNLAHFASRKYFLSNIELNTTENLYAWIKNPPAVKPNTQMPFLALTDKEVNALVYYIKTLR
ncbi:MAG: cytochrome c oxidase subunit II [Cytophagaceae bacterium]|nr:cytochrome c oxidase subunit II [Cytophagaceae bacterium]